MYLCSSCLISLSYNEKIVRCAGKGCSNNPEPKKGQIRLLFNLSYGEMQKVIDAVGLIKEVVGGFINDIPWMAIRKFAISSRRDLEEKIVEALVCEISIAETLAEALETTKCLECLAAEKIGWKTLLCQSCGKFDHLEDVKNAFKKGFLGAKGSPKVAEKMAIVFTTAFLSLLFGEDPFKKEVKIYGGDSLAGLGLLGRASNCTTTV